ncbi:hypothetical protein HS125_00795 [bacterium]|nr:hypothetical protein [bacterium]
MALADRPTALQSPTCATCGCSAVFAFILLLNFTPLGARSALIVSGTTLLLALYGLIVLSVAHPLVGFVVGCKLG